MGSPTSSAEIAAKMPHIDAGALQGRTMLLMPVWDGAAWNMWVDAPPGQLIKVQIVEPIRSNYLATVPADKYDLQIPFVDFMWQRASWPGVARQIMGICHDFHQLATIAVKLEHLHEARGSIDANLLTSFVQGEVEQLIIVARSIFDLIQEITAHFWNDRIMLLDPAAEAIRRQRKMPDTFAKIALNGDLPRTPAEIAQRYGVPPRASAMYAKNTPFFCRFANRETALSTVAPASITSMPPRKVSASIRNRSITAVILGNPSTNTIRISFRCARGSRMRCFARSRLALKSCRPSPVKSRFRRRSHPRIKSIFGTRQTKH
jgi:hypothetical protein